MIEGETGMADENGRSAGHAGDGVRRVPTRIVSTRRDEVGESAVWSADEACLYRVDITGRALCRLDPATGQEDEWPMPEIVTSVGLARGGLILGLRKRVCLYEPGGQLRELATIEPDLPRNRLNEGTVAPDGSYWVGTMRDNIAPDGEDIGIASHTGALHRVAPDGTVTQLTPNEAGICNTMVWANGRFITADTLGDALYAYSIQGEGLGPHVPFAERIGPGLPDGSAVDADGFLWNARFGGGCVVRLAPDGTVDRTVALPCTNPTSCAFGGPDHRTLYVTSARFGLTADALEEEPRNGGLLALDVGIGGRSPNIFG